MTTSEGEGCFKQHSEIFFTLGLKYVNFLINQKYYLFLSYEVKESKYLFPFL